MSPGWSGSFLTHRDLKGQEGKSQAKIKATGLPGSGTHARPYDEKDLDKFEKQITDPGWLEPGEEWRGRGESRVTWGGVRRAEDGGFHPR